MNPRLGEITAPNETPRRIEILPATEPMKTPEPQPREPVPSHG